MVDRKKICLDFYSLCRNGNSGVKEGLNQFFYSELLRKVWSSFEAFLALNFPAKKPYKMRENYSKEYESKFFSWSFSDDYKVSLRSLITLSPVKDESPIYSSEPYFLNKTSSLCELLNYLYRIRSNLDHGAKNLLDNTSLGQRDRDLVEHGFKVTFNILEKTLLYKGWIS